MTQITPRTREIFARLIGFDTVSANPNMALMDYVVGLLAEAGINATLIPDPAGGKANLYATVGQGSGGVMLSGHTDVVPVEGQAWSHPPFTLTEADGRFYGRGAADMKGFCAAAIATMITAGERTKAGHPLAVPLHLAADFIGAVRALQADVALNGVQDGDYDVPYNTLHVGKMAGGVQVNIVPNHATLDFEIRSVAQDDPAVLIDRLRQAAEDICAPLRATFPEAAIKIERQWDYPGLGTKSDAAVVSFVKALTGANGTMKVAFGTEGGLFDARLGIATVICGPGSMAQGHKPDEYVSVEQMARCEAMMAALLTQLEAGF